MYHDDYTDTKYMIKRRAPSYVQNEWLDTLRAILQLPTFDGQRRYL